MYRELRLPAGLSHLACGWVSDGAAASVLPDGCVDLVLSGDRVVVAGPATSAVEVTATPGQPGCGVRFRVGAAGAALGVPVDQLRDLTVPLADVWGTAGQRLSGRVAAATSVGAALGTLVRGLAEPRAAIDPLTRWAALQSTGKPFGEVSRDVGFSERQLRRRVEQAVGYGPRMLLRVLRLQRFLSALHDEPSRALAQLAADAGYADQAHLTRECRRLTGRTPAALQAAGAGPAGEQMSESF